MKASPEECVKAAAREAGFDLCGIAGLEAPPQTLDRLLPWLEAGRHADMAWMERQAAKRLDPGSVLPGARSMICVAQLYNTRQPYSTDLFPMAGREQTAAPEGEGKGWISRYAWGEDYHRVLTRKLEALEQALRERVDGQADYRSYCDTGPISEKSWAAAAGLGWQGKHTNLINRKLGSWIFLGEILTTLPLRPDPPAADHCGTCTRCLDACPTQAFPRAYELDAGRCLSYLTIEKRGEIQPEFADSLGANVYGCDICQDVCPWNRGRVLSTEAAFEARPGLVAPDLEALRGLDDAAFAERFKILGRAPDQSFGFAPKRASSRAPQGQTLPTAREPLMEIVFDKGVYLPEIDLWLDPHEAKPDATGFVSHAHGDHARWHGTTLASSPTLRLMRARETPPPDRVSKPQAFLQRFKHNNALLTLLPAGHVAGSAQLLIDYKKETLLYSGDFKLRPDPACEPIQVREADQLIMETTFGQAQYLFPPASKTIERIAAFIQKAHKDKKVPVLLAYSLGKAQELMLSLKPWNWEFVVHPSIAAVCEAYKGLGYALPPSHLPGDTGLDHKVLIWPPDGRRHAWYSSVSSRCRTAFISGWAMDPGTRAKYAVDETFPLSDHADFSELLAYVWQVHPKKIHTHHGFAAEFASHLSLTGHDAGALGLEEQLRLL